MQTPRPLDIPPSMHVSGHTTPAINNFPVEILCRIFFDALRFPPSSIVSSHLAFHRSNIVLLKLTAVCRHWRSVALEYATLWTGIAFSTSVLSTIQCAALFLVRSKEAMLSVCIMNSYPGDRETTRSCKELLRAIFSQSHRLSTCDFSSTSSSFWNNWAFPAPKLRKLTIKGYGTGAPFGFHGQAPLLESVTLLHYLPWPLGNYPSLRQVDLWNREHRDVSLALLLDALRGCEVLEELALHGYAHLANEVSHPAPVPLPRLLKVDFFSCDSALILEHLETRSPECFVTIFDLNPGQDILRSLPRDQSRALPYLWGITELRVVLHSYSSQYHIAGHREDGSVVLYIAARGVDRSRWAWVRASIGAIASFSHFSSTRKLTLSTDIPFISWDMWLPNLNHLQDLTVSCPRSEGLLRGLLGSSPQTGLPFCPSLQNLALYQCGGCAIVDGLGLIKFVVSRYSAGRPLRQLSLHKGDWDRIQQLDSSWAALAQSQSTRGGNVFINLPLNMDVEGLGYRYCTSDGVGWV